MKKAKQDKDFFSRYLGKIYDVSDMLCKEGCSDAECRYKEIVATIMLFIREDLHVIRMGLFFFGSAILTRLLLQLV